MPVQVGERVMEIADTTQVQLKINLSIDDAIVLKIGAEVDVFLDADPLNPIKAVVTSTAYIAEKYNQAFGEFTELEAPATKPEIEHAWHLYLLRLNLDQLEINRNQFIDELKTRNIGTSVHFIPLHIHPYYRETYGYKPNDFPVAYEQYQRVISLPIYSKMSDRDVLDVIEAVGDIVVKYRKENVY